jgi:hypothetical protein
VAFGRVRSKADQQNEFDHHLLLDASSGGFFGKTPQ